MSVQPSLIESVAAASQESWPTDVPLSVPLQWDLRRRVHCLGHRTYVPDKDSLRTDVIKLFHEPPYAGHLGRDKLPESWLAGTATGLAYMKM